MCSNFHLSDKYYLLKSYYGRHGIRCFMGFYIILSATPEETYSYLYFTEEEIEVVCICKHSGGWVYKMYEMHMAYPEKREIIIVIAAWDCSKV